jgi:hypothetical protein
MPALAVSADGENIFVALEDEAGLPVILTAARSDLATWTAAYEPGAGTSANVASVPSDVDMMLFYGNFGSGIQVVAYVISTDTPTNISPTGLTTKIVNTLQVDPSDPNIIQITVNTDQDFLATYDGGTVWVDLNTAVGFDVTAQLALWAGSYDYDRSFLGGAVAGVAALRYSPNEGASLSDVTGAALAGASVNIIGLEGVEP